jgi:phosphatidate cytidylyltransferase
MTRIASAIVLIAILAGTLIWLPPAGTVVLAMIVSALAAVELVGLAREQGEGGSPLFVGVAAAIWCAAAAGPFWPGVGPPPVDFAALSIGLTLAAGLLALAFIRPGPHVLPSLAVMLLAPLYVGLPLGALAWVRTSVGPEAVVWLIAVLIVSDSAQYYVGTALGRRKLAPVISPGKTIEGLIGGLVAAPIAGAAVGIWALPMLSIGVTAALAFVLALFGVAGDLFESLLKRSAGVKDSSTLIPGHGGVLDRIDAYLFAAPVYFLALRYVL